MQQATSIDFWYWDSFVPKQVCESYIDKLFNEESAIDGEYLMDSGYSVGPDRDTKVCADAAESEIGFFLFSRILLANQQANWLFNVDRMENAQINKYPVGGHYNWHVDQDVYNRDGSDSQRKLSVSLLLSDPSTYEGGDLLLKKHNGPITRAQGSVIVFPSFVEHTVTPVTSGVRFSAVSWARGPHFR